MGNLTKLQDKWERPGQTADSPPVEPSADPPARSDRSVRLTRWRDSQPVVELSDYLKQCGHIKLGIRAGVPALDFDPPLGPKDLNGLSDRFAQACKAVDLLLAASNDLAFLLSKDLIRLQDLDPPGTTVRESKPATGPF